MVVSKRENKTKEQANSGCVSFATSIQSKDEIKRSAIAIPTPELAKEMFPIRPNEGEPKTET